MCHLNYKCKFLKIHVTNLKIRKYIKINTLLYDILIYTFSRVL